MHVEDLAIAALAACDAATAQGAAYDLPGGETLAFREMVARMLAVLPGRPKLLALPAPMFVAGMQVARLAGRGGAVGDSALARLREDLVFDPLPAAHNQDHAPRAFRPTADMFVRRPPGP